MFSSEDNTENSTEEQLLKSIQSKRENAITKLCSSFETIWDKTIYEHNNIEVGKFKIRLSDHYEGQTTKQVSEAIVKSWFVDFEPTRAKVAAKKHWIAINDVIETNSATCYAGEFDYLNTKKRTLSDTMIQAAMTVISGQALEQLERLNSEQLEQLKMISDFFPSELVVTKLGEIPLGWGDQTIDNIIELMVSMPK